MVFEDGIGQVKPKQKEQKISNFSQWLDAFTIFASVYFVKHPMQAIPMFRYMALIKRGAEKVKGNWIYYDIQFRLKKSYITSLSWASVHAELRMMEFNHQLLLKMFHISSQHSPAINATILTTRVSVTSQIVIICTVVFSFGFHSLVKCYKANATATTNHSANSNCTNRFIPHSRNQQLQHPKGRP